MSTISTILLMTLTSTDLAYISATLQHIWQFEFNHN